MSKKINEEKEINKGLKLLAKSSFVVFIGLFLSKILTYLYRIIIARQFGPEIYGVFSLAVMIAGWFIAIFSLGVIEGFVRFIPQYRGKKKYGLIKDLIHFYLIILLSSSILGGILLFFSASYISIILFKNNELIIFLKFFAFLIPFWIISNLLLSILRGFEKINSYSFILNILSNFIKLLCLIIFLFLGFKSNSIIFSFSLGIIAILLASYYSIKKNIPEIYIKERHSLKFKEKKYSRKDLFSYSWPIIFSGILSSLFVWTDSFVIGYFKGVFEVGIYNAAVPIAMLMLFVPELFMTLFSPLINRQYSQKNLFEVKEISKQVSKWIFTINLPIFLLVFFFPEAILNILFNSAYLAGKDALRILSFGFFISSIFYTSSNFITMVGKSKLILFNLFLSFIMNLLLNIFLIPKYGLYGAAISTTLSWLFLAILWVSEGYYFTKILPLRRKMFTIFFFSLLPISLLFLLKNKLELTGVSFFLIGSFFILLYFVIILLTGSLDKNDKLILSPLFSSK